MDSKRRLLKEISAWQDYLSLSLTLKFKILFILVMILAATEPVASVSSLHCKG